MDIEAILIMGCSYYGQQNNKEVSNYTIQCCCVDQWYGVVECDSVLYCRCSAAILTTIHRDCFVITL